MADPLIQVENPRRQTSIGVTEPACVSRGEIASLYRQLDGSLRAIVGFNVRACAPVIEDACQVAWVRLLRAPERVRRETVLPWLVTTATREALRLLRRAGRELPLEAAADGRSGPSPEQVVELRARLDSVRCLPTRQQRLVWLHGLGFNYAEMSGRTGASRRTVERQLLRAKRTLRSG